MSEHSGDVEVEVPQTGNQILPKDVTAEIGSIKLFNKWTYEDVEIRDISLTWTPLHYLPDEYNALRRRKRLEEISEQF